MVRYGPSRLPDHADLAYEMCGSGLISLCAKRGPLSTRP